MMDDWGLQIKTFDTTTAGSQGSHNMDIDFKGIRYERYGEIKMTNTTTALGVLAELVEKQKAVVLLRLIHLNLPEKFNTLLQKLQFLEDHLSSSSKLKSSSQLLLKLSANIRRALVSKCNMRKSLLIGMLTDVQSCVPASYYASGTGRFPCWVPFDVCMETAMDGKQFPVTSAIDILTETISTLQIFNGASWQETFLALWLSALRLVQRERDPLEGPVPHLDARLCILLSITPLAIAQVLADNSKIYSPLFLEGGTSRFTETEGEMSGMAHASKRQGLVSALQLLGIHPALLCPPASSVIAANKAVSKAASFICKMKNVKYGFATGDSDNTLVKAGGDLRHLIVEACIARKLVDTSAYLWPGYVPASLSCVSDPSPLQRSPWSTFMEGAPLTGPLINALISTPASSLAEIEKLHHIALNGTQEEKSAAAKIICGASLVCGWNIQEHVVRIIVKLLSPEPANYKGTMSHLVDYQPMLSSILFGITSIDTVHILSLHGMVPEVAASLIPLCEAFGSLEPLSSRSSSTYNESVYMVFSYAFLFLLRLWKFYRPPLEQ